jgi:hypothetical protein
VLGLRVGERRGEAERDADDDDEFRFHLYWPPPRERVFWLLKHAADNLLSV